MFVYGTEPDHSDFRDDGIHCVLPSVYTLDDRHTLYTVDGEHVQREKEREREHHKINIHGPRDNVPQ